MKFPRFLLFSLLILGSICTAQRVPKTEDATAAVLHAFETHDVVMFGEMHGNKQEYEWLRSLVASPEFADRVDDVVMEFGNSLYQKSVDRYIAGEDVPLEQVQRAWRNTVGGFWPASPVYASLYQAVRETNLKRPGKHQMRILCGDPYVDWEKVRDREDITPYLGNRDKWYTQVVKDAVLANHHRALLIMGSLHFLRFQGPGYIEDQLRQAGAKTYLIVFGTNAVGSYDDLDHRLDSWAAPVIVSLADTWVGEFPAMPVVSGGEGGPKHAIIIGTGPPPVKLKDAADALLYLGPRESLTQVSMTRADLEGTPYGKEIQRRLTIEGFPSSWGAGAEKAEAPQFPRPTSSDNAPSPPPPPPPKNMGAALPPRPPSQ
jgi:hypothetical protein